MILVLLQVLFHDHILGTVRIVINQVKSTVTHSSLPYRTPFVEKCTWWKKKYPFLLVFMGVLCRKPITSASASWYCSHQSWPFVSKTLRPSPSHRWNMVSFLPPYINIFSNIGQKTCNHWRGDDYIHLNAKLILTSSTPKRCKRKLILAKFEPTRHEPKTAPPLRFFRHANDSYFFTTHKGLHIWGTKEDRQGSWGSPSDQPKYATVTKFIDHEWV